MSGRWGFRGAGSEPSIYVHSPRPEGTRGKPLTTVHFTCPDCEQTIEVNDAMRETILDAGCPVCTAAAAEEDFAVACE